MRKAGILSAVLGLFVAAPAVMAHDLFAPAWRGLPGSRSQAWAFSDSSDPAPATSATHGSPTADITLGNFNSGWLDNIFLGTQTGYWDLGMGGTIDFSVDAGPNPDLLEIVVQVTYYQDPVAAPSITIPGATLVPGSEQATLYEDDLLGSWMHSTSTWTMPVNPGSLQVLLTADGAWGSTIDHVVIDTYVVPEPATILALGIGCALLRRRRTA